MNKTIGYCIIICLLSLGFNAQAQLGTHSGVGLIFSIDTSRGYKIPKVDAVVPDAPAEAAGLRAGDILISVDGTPLRGKTWEEATNLIKGAAGTTVKLEIESGGYKQTFTITRKEYEYANSYYNNANPSDPFCVSVCKLMNDAAYGFKHSRGVETDKDSSEQIQVSYYKSYAEVPGTVKTLIYNKASAITADIILATDAKIEGITQKSEGFSLKLKSGFPDYYYDKVKGDATALSNIIIGRKSAKGYETPVLQMFIRRAKGGYEAVLRVLSGDKHWIMNIENAPTENDISAAVRKILNDVPYKFEHVKGIPHNATQSDWTGTPWNELNTIPKGATDCSIGRPMYGGGCACSYYEGTSAAEAKVVFDDLAKKVTEALGKPYSYDTNKPLLSLAVPSSAVEVYNFGKKATKEHENCPVITVYLNKGAGGKYNVEMIIQQDGM